MDEIKPKEKKQMTADEAISLLDQVCGTVSLTRENHTRVLVAVGVVRNAIKNGDGAKARTVKIPGMAAGGDAAK